MNDHDSLIPCAAIKLRALRQPSDRDRLDEDQSSAWWRSDTPEDSTLFQKSWTIATVRWRSDDRVMPSIANIVGHPIAINAKPSIDADRTLLVMPRVYRWAVDHLHLLLEFSTCSIADRVDSGPLDLSRSARIRRSSRRHVACKVRNVWEHSPTRKTRKDFAPIN